MVKMIATKPITYDMRTVQAGDEFEVADHHVATLVSLGRARATDAKSTKVEPVKTSSTEEKPPAEASGKYATRRMKADDDNSNK